MIGSRNLLFAVSFIAYLGAMLPPVAAQETEESDTQAWFQYQVQRGVTEKIVGSWDLGYRELVSTEDVLGKWSRLHMRGVFSYEHSRRISFEGGIGSYYTFSNKVTDLFELRTWLGTTLSWPRFRVAGRQLEPTHRFRLEQRWVHQRDKDETDFNWRFRYRLATFIPLNRPTIEEKTWYLPLMAEAFSDLGGETSEFFAARLRVTTGVGYVFSENWTLEFRYTAQKSRDTVLDRFTTTDHIFDLRIRTALRIRDLGKSL